MQDENLDNQAKDYSKLEAYVEEARVNNPQLDQLLDQLDQIDEARAIPWAKIWEAMTTFNQQTAKETDGDHQN